jgi:hypothetical protein
LRISSLISLSYRKKKRAAPPQKSLGVSESRLTRELMVTVYLSADDQQRINTFSKLNSRVRNLVEKLGELRVSWWASNNYFVGSTSPPAGEGSVG